MRHFIARWPRSRSSQLSVTVIGPAPGGSVGTLIRNLRPSFADDEVAEIRRAGRLNRRYWKSGHERASAVPPATLRRPSSFRPERRRTARVRRPATGDRSRPWWTRWSVTPASVHEPNVDLKLPRFVRRIGQAPAGRELTLRFLGLRCAAAAPRCGWRDPTSRCRVSSPDRARETGSCGRRATNRSGTSPHRPNGAIVRRHCPGRASRRGRAGRADSSGTRAVRRSGTRSGTASVCEDEVRAVTKFRPRSSMPRSARIRCRVDAGERDPAFIGREAEIDIAVGRTRRAQPDATAIEPHQLAQAAAAAPRRQHSPSPKRRRASSSCSTCSP